MAGGVGAEAALIGREVTEQGLRSGVAEAVRQLELRLGAAGSADPAEPPAGRGVDQEPLALSCRVIWQWVRHEVVARSLVEQIVHEQTVGLTRGGQVFDLFVQTALGPRRP